MNSFTKVAKAAIVGIVLSGSLLSMTACDNRSQPAASAPTSPAASQSASATPKPLSDAAKTQAPVDNSLTQAERDAAIAGSITAQFDRDPASVAIPNDVKQAFGETASANLVRDAFAFQQMADGFQQLQVVPRTVDMKSMAGIVSARLSPLMTPDAHSDVVKQFSSPEGTAVIPMLTEEDFDGMMVDGKTYNINPAADGFIFTYGEPVVTMGTTTVPVTDSGQTIQVKTANVSMQVDIQILATEGVVKVNEKRSLNLIADNEGHWQVAGAEYPLTITATDK